MYRMEMARQSPTKRKQQIYKERYATKDIHLLMLDMVLVDWNANMDFFQNKGREKGSWEVSRAWEVKGSLEVGRGGVLTQWRDGIPPLSPSCTTQIGALSLSPQ